MCNYKYEYTKHQLTGLPCIYPSFYEEYSHKFPQTKSLPHDSDGYCVFHSKDKKWKLQNGFTEKFYELLTTTEEICHNKPSPKWAYNFSGFYFLQEEGTLLLTNCPKGISIDVRFCEFLNGLSIETSQINSIDLGEVTFHEICLLSNVIFDSGINATNAKFNNGIIISNCTLEGYNYFDNCIFKNLAKIASTNCWLKDSITDYLNFENSTFESNVTFERTVFKKETVFDKAKFLDEFYFHHNEINALFSFREASFQLSENANPMFSSADFKKVRINTQGKLIFKGSTPFENVVQGELEMNFEDEPQGLVSFENFNLNKISLLTKLNLFELEKLGKVEIGQGCRKYYCQTDIFEILAKKPDQILILDLVKVFCNYFEVHNHYNLGIEVIERKPDLIRYFFFTDEIISKEEFEMRIKQNEFDLWQTFSKLSENAENQLHPIFVEEKDQLIELGSLFLKIRHRILSMEYQEPDLKQLVRSVAMDGISVIENSISISKISNSNLSYYKELPPLKPAQPVYNNPIIVTGDKNIIAPGNQGHVSSHFELKKEDDESKDLAEQSIKWTKKQTYWTIIGVIVATILSILTLIFTGYI